MLGLARFLAILAGFLHLDFNSAVVDGRIDPFLPRSGPDTLDHLFLGFVLHLFLRTLHFLGHGIPSARLGGVGSVVRALFRVCQACPSTPSRRHGSGARIRMACRFPSYRSLVSDGNRIPRAQDWGASRKTTMLLRTSGRSPVSRTTTLTAPPPQHNINLSFRPTCTFPLPPRFPLLAHPPLTNFYGKAHVAGHVKCRDRGNGQLLMAWSSIERVSMAKMVRDEGY